MQDEIRSGTLLNGRYQVERELGRGRMGAVYLAHDLRLRRPVAIKVALLASSEARAGFLREVECLQKLHHHSLPWVWDTFNDTQRDFLVMEYIPGDDLETMVQQQGPQPEWLVLRWADELLDVLDYLHTQNPPIIHRDVKPGNLKLRQNDTLVLVDFGIAKEYLPGVNTVADATAVTPSFSPPEQYANSLTDGCSDLYSVGATMYFLLTGVAPAPAPARVSGDQKLLPPSQLVPSISTGAEMVVRKALSLPRDQRWASAAEMRQMVDQAAQRLATKQETGIRRPRRNVDNIIKWLPIVLAVLALILSLVTVQVVDFVSRDLLMLTSIVLLVVVIVGYRYYHTQRSEKQKDNLRRPPISRTQGLAQEAPQMRLRLRVLQTPGQPAVREAVIESFPFVIGRKEGDFILSDDKRMSGRHAQITASGNQFFIEDLDSTNHSFLDGEQLNPRQPARLGNPARARFGPDTEIEFKAL